MHLHPSRCFLPPYVDSSGGGARRNMYQEPSWGNGENTTLQWGLQKYIIPYKWHQGLENIYCCVSKDA
ncbi:hypothetical protein XELAEV_18028106mg [Xenopus laevis]|uniref:Uncharacterized protein n=1 Tax=Xenopus laevis TaxID=8355 RepID=A0A974HKD6_XENLA|nr:hypothetical protein XELAEV_18028106mg [Xenopus laevis]